MTKVYLSLGSNLGPKAENIEIAIKYINNAIGEVILQSALYQYEPWGFVSEHQFLNSAICVETESSAQQTLKLTQQIEEQMGRLNKTPYHAIYEDRIIDIDILFYSSYIIHTKDLIIPHPLISERKFVLEPLNEIAPDFIHPILKKSIKELLTQII